MSALAGSSTGRFGAARSRLLAAFLALTLVLPLPNAALAASDSSSSDATLRVIAEVGGGVAGLAGTVLLGSLVFLLSDSGGGIEGFANVFAAGLVTATATLFLVPLGIWGAGELAGGDSSYWLTVAGYAAGAVTGLLITLLPDMDGFWVLLVTATLGIAGGIIGYELGNESDDVADRASDDTALHFAPPRMAGVQVVPVPGGAIVGVGIAF